MKRILPSLFIVSFFLLTSQLQAQYYKVRGTVYDSSRNYPLEAVSVMASSGGGTVTNSDGNYEITVTEKDSIWFSYLNKPTIKFPVLKITNPMQFDLSLQVNIPVMREVKVRQRNYRQDSMQNRVDYAKIFNYQKPRLTPSITSGGVGFDLDEIINMFRFRRNRSMASFQRRLLIEEEEKFVDHRFNKALVRRLTLLDGAELDSFMRIWRPTVEFTRTAGDYEFQSYIKAAYYYFRRGYNPNGELEEKKAF